MGIINKNFVYSLYVENGIPVIYSVFTFKISSAHPYSLCDIVFVTVFEYVQAIIAMSNVVNGL